MFLLYLTFLFLASFFIALFDIFCYNFIYSDIYRIFILSNLLELEVNMRILFVNNKFHNKKVISFLENEFPMASKNSFYKTLRKKDIRVNDVKISDNVSVCEGDKVSIYISDNLLFPNNISFDIVYEDDNILIVNKPKGIEVTGESSLSSLIQSNFNNPDLMPCHRLDRNTSGLVIFAKSSSVLDILLEKFKNREIDKFYKCKVFGILKKKHDILKAYLFKDNKKSLVYISDDMKKGYREIITEYKVLGENVKDNFSVLEVILHTGRTHQIRAHLAHIGHPIIGDRKIWQL